MNFTAHRMNTGLSDIFNENSVEKLLKNDSSPQTTNLARINTGIAEMLFGRTETPKGIGTQSDRSMDYIKCLEEQKPQRGLELIVILFLLLANQVWKNRNPKGDWNLSGMNNDKNFAKFGRTETPKGIGT